MNAVLLEKQEKIKELKEEKINIDEELMKVRHVKFSLETENIRLSNEIFQLKQLLRQYRGITNFSIRNSILKDTIKAVKYAMKHAHPDNGGADDFIKFQKVYEELTNK